MAIGTLLEIYKACATYNNKKDKLRKFHSISAVLFFVKDDPSIPRVSKTARVFWRFTSLIWKWFNDLLGSLLVLTTLDFNILSLFSSSASFSAILSNANLSRSWGEKNESPFITGLLYWGVKSWNTRCFRGFRYSNVWLGHYLFTKTNLSHIIQEMKL